jgi:predicted amidohydrolase
MEFIITLVQIPCVEGKREKNFKKVSQWLEGHSPQESVEFIILPELFAIGFNHEDYATCGPGTPGPTSEFLQELAEGHSAYVLATAIEQTNSKYYNTLVIANPSGKILGLYRKMHPFQEEKDVFKAGDKLVLFSTHGIKVGVQICYDIRFPEVTRRLAIEGAELVLMPAAFPDPRSAHWSVLVQVRAIENQCYFAAANRIGYAFDGKTYFGHSQIVDPWGVVLNRPTSEERIITTTGDTVCIESVRNQITCFDDRSPTGYENVEWFHDEA